MSSIPKIDIDILYLEERIAPILDNFGQQGSDTDSNIRRAGLHWTDIDLVKHDHGDVFSNYDTELGHWSEVGNTPADGLCFILNHRIRLDGCPLWDDCFHLPGNSKYLAEWREALGAYAPLLTRLHRKISSTPTSLRRSTRCVVDINGSYGACIAVVTPVRYAHLYQDVRPIVQSYANQAPPSAHERVEALAQINWRFDDKRIPSAAVPGPGRRAA